MRVAPMLIQIKVPGPRTDSMVTLVGSLSTITHSGAVSTPALTAHKRDSGVYVMRPKIGLALGSGAARGWSQIGIVESLASLGVVPDVVCGTSIGALVGAAFVTGKLAALKALIENFGRRDVAAMFDVRLATGGLIEGKRVETFLDGLGIAGSIETLNMKYGAVATDLASGREIWLQAGPIGRAVRASIGMPGIFSPAEHADGGWLIDGGLVNPVPVSLARALGADIVIAVDLNSELVGRRFGELTDSTAAPAASSRVPQWLNNALGPLLGRVLQRSQPSELLRGLGQFPQHYAGPHHPITIGRRPARRPPSPGPGQLQLVGLSSCEGSHFRRFGMRQSRTGGHRARMPQGGCRLG